MRAARCEWEPTGVTGKLESKLAQILTGFVRIATSVKAQRSSDEASRRRWAEELRARKERIDQERRLDKLRQSLVKNLGSWERAQRLRAFIQATVEASPPHESSQMALTMWVSWAARQVELLDPLKVNISNVIVLAVNVPTSEYGYWSSSKK